MIKNNLRMMKMRNLKSKDLILNQSMYNNSEKIKQSIRNINKLSKIIKLIINKKFKELNLINSLTGNFRSQLVKIHNKQKEPIQRFHNKIIINNFRK